MTELYIEKFNGFTGKGKTQRQAEIACAYASAYLPLAHERETEDEGTAVFGDLGAWNGQEEECYKALLHH